VGISIYEKCWYVCVMEMCWVDRCCVLTFGSGGARSTEGCGDFRLLTLWSVDGCRIACCVHHSVFRFTVAEGILRAGTERRISVCGGWVREAGIG